MTLARRIAALKSTSTISSMVEKMLSKVTANCSRSRSAQAALAASLACACASSACTTSPYDGQVFQSTTIAISGFGVGPSERIIVEALNPANGKFEQIASLYTSTTSSFLASTSLGMATFYSWSSSIQIPYRYVVPPPHYCECTTTCSHGICGTSCPLCATAGDVTLRFSDASSPGYWAVFGLGELTCTRNKIGQGVLADVAAQECGAGDNGVLHLTISP